MVAAFDYCLHGKGGAAPSIDTAMHGLVDAAHVDHLHPDSGIALATAVGRGGADPQGASATGWCGCRGGAPASSSAWTSRRSRPRTRRPSAASSAGTASPPGATPREQAEANSLEIIRTAEQFLADNGTAEPFGAVVPGYEALPEAERRAKAAAMVPDDPRASPRRTGRRSGTSPTPTWCWSSCPGRSSPRWPSWARPARTTSCGPRSSRWSSTCPRPRRWRRSWPGCRSCTRPTAPTTRATTTATPPPTPRRSGVRTRRSCWSPGSGCSPSARTSRPPGSPASSTSTRST